MTARKCDDCSTPFEAKRSDARFCSAACRKRAGRAAERAVTNAPKTRQGAGTADELLMITVAATVELAGLTDSYLGALANTLARDISHAVYGAGAHAGLSKELRLVMAEIVPAKPVAKGDPVQGIRGRGASRRTSPTALRIVS